MVECKGKLRVQESHLLISQPNYNVVLIVSVIRVSYSNQHINLSLHRHEDCDVIDVYLDGATVVSSSGQNEYCCM